MATIYLTYNGIPPVSISEDILKPNFQGRQIYSSKIEISMIFFLEKKIQSVWLSVPVVEEVGKKFTFCKIRG